IVWLALLGYRKRRYSSGMGSMQGWTSAHVYLGVAVWLLATLHCAAEFGWNIHTFAYALMTFVIVSGMFGVYAYLSLPRQTSDNSAGVGRSELFAELYQLNREGADIAHKCAGDVQTAALSSIQRSKVGGGVWSQLVGRDASNFETLEDGGVANPDQTPVIDYVASRIPKAGKRSEVTFLRELLAVLCRRQTVLRQLREEIRLKSWLKIWLYVHVPMTFATIAALIAHVFSTFVYW
ncbi:MAG: hypothetical protein O6766_13200, partial [Gammaproteobacteria bacterium]|nr:hypothetical protein [Gammaproteobacteria bacterium]